MHAFHSACSKRSRHLRSSVLRRALHNAILVCATLLACIATSAAQTEPKPAISLAPTTLQSVRPSVAPSEMPAFHFTVNPAIIKNVRTYHEVADKAEHPVATVKDDQGTTSEFVEDEIVVRNDPAEVEALVKKYHAKVLRQITVNVTSEDGSSLGPAKTTPRTVLQLDATDAPVDLQAAAKGTKLQGEHVFSSERASRLAAIIASEQTAGHAVNLNFLMQPTDFPTSSIEQKDSNGVNDAFQWPEFDRRAWQYAIDAGIKTHPMVAIIDGGFWLTLNGVPCGINADPLFCGPLVKGGGSSDLPAHFLQGDATGGSGPAGGTNPASCTGGAVCHWHGNGTASVILGNMNNKYGAIGTGAPAAVPFLIKVDMSFSEVIAAIEAAVSHGASVVNISGGGGCGVWCALWEEAGGNDYVEPAVARSQGVLVVASAGNDGQDSWDEKFWPCILSLCVGAIDEFPTNHPFTQTDWFAKSYSNFGSSVQLWAPTDIHAMPDGDTFPALQVHKGTSASAPYVSGIAALMKAVNPGLTANQIASLLFNTGSVGVTTAPEVLQPGHFIQPFAAVKAANGNQPQKPEIHITSPNNEATVTQTFTAGQVNAFQGVTFTATASDILAGNWPIPQNSPFATGGIVWKSSLDGLMNPTLETNDGTSISFHFASNATPGKRTVTATATNKEGGTASDSITVNYQPVFSPPLPVITYPAPSATLPAGTIQVRGNAQSALGGYLPCSSIVWQKGIAATPIPSTAVNGTTDTCGASVPFSASATPQTLKMTATDSTGKSADATEKLTIKPAGSGVSAIVLGIDNPTPGQEYLVINGGPTLIQLHSFAQNVPASVNLAYTWSWYQTGSNPNTALPLGTGPSMIWADTSVCGAVTVQVAATASAIPPAENPTATQQINISCERIQ
jgi:hypothetical protein